MQENSINTVFSFSKILLVLVWLQYSYCFSQNFEWAFHAGSSNNDLPNRITIDKDNNLYVTSIHGDSIQYSSQTIYSGQSLLAKHDSDGNIHWITNAKGAVIKDASTDLNGNCYITGQCYNCVFYGTTDTIAPVQNDNYEAFIAKLNVNGNVVWFSLGSSEKGDLGTAIKTDAQGNSYVCGTGCSGEVCVSFVSKFNSSGDLLWQIKTGGPSAFGSFVDLDIDEEGNCYVIGTFLEDLIFGNDTILAQNNYEQIFTAKLNNSGNIIWAKKEGNSNHWVESISLDGKGNYFICYNGGGMYLAKHDTAGLNIWTKFAESIEPLLPQIAYGVACDDLGNVYMTGWIKGLVKFGEGNDTVLLNNPLSRSLVVAKYSTDGHFLWALQPGGIHWNGDHQVMGITIDNNNKCIIAGGFEDTIVFGDSVFISKGRWDIFIARINENIIENIPLKGLINQEIPIIIFPNPAHKAITVSFSNKESSAAEIIIRNLLGEIIFSEKKEYFSPQSCSVINLPELAAGVYFVEVVCGEERRTKKIIIE